MFFTARTLDSSYSRVSNKYQASFEIQSKELLLEPLHFVEQTNERTISLCEIVLARNLESEEQ